MPTFETRVTVGIYCTCGTPLVPESFGFNNITVKPCPMCTQAQRVENELLKKQINRKGVMVDERST